MKIYRYLTYVFFMLATACDSTKTVENTIDTFEVVRPLIKDTPYTSEYVAEIHSVKYVEVRSRIKGYIEKIHVDEGEKVKEGQLLFSLNPSVFEKELQKANALNKSAVANLKAAEVDLANVKRLVAKDIIAKSELEVALAKVEALKAEVDESLANKDKASIELSYTELRAPYQGIINRIPNKTGSLIDEGTMLTSITDNTEVFAYFNLSEIEYLDNVSIDEKMVKNVNFVLANNTPYHHEGKLQTVESEFDRLTGNIAFRARFPNPSGILKHGSHGKIIVNKVLKDAMLIPQKSTLEIQDKLYVFIVDTEGTLSQRNITVKMRLPDYFAVESGLKKNETFLLEGVEKVRNGTKIFPKKGVIDEAITAASN